ncbi:MAG TPA: isochorismatase family cysteine hydrolase [Candidatus Binatia bacterium]|nr:isochorismatase family cysteine hydrolase [Candidatus Binatia bacterium]
MTSTLGPEERLRRPALVVVDMQNDFVRVGAPLEVPEARGTFSAHHLLLETFRRHHLPVVYTRFVTEPSYTLLWEWSPQCRPPTRCCWKGHRRFYADVQKELDCTEIVDELAPEREDVVIEKHGYGGFHGTALADVLRGAGVESLVITGTVTQICVEETAREAFHHGFKTTLVADAVSSYAPDLHAATLKNFALKFGWVDSSQTIARHLG